MLTTWTSRNLRYLIRAARLQNKSEPSHSALLPSPNGAQQSHLRCWPGSSFGCAFCCLGASRPLSFSGGSRVGYGLLVVFCFVGALYGLSKGKSGQEASKDVLLVSHREQSSSQQQQNQSEPMDSAAFCACFYRSGVEGILFSFFFHVGAER